jgi:hypothetical protein
VQEYHVSGLSISSMTPIHLLNILPSTLERPAVARSISQASSSIAVGETIPAVIAEKSGSSSVILTMKGQSFQADSHLPLAQGEKIMVKVEQIHPQMVLRILNRESTASLILNESNRSYSANPESLKEMFEIGRDILNQKALMELLPEKAKENIKNLLKIMDTSVFTATSMKNPLFIKDFISNLGLLSEHNLMKIIQNKGDICSLSADKNLKGYLIALSEELQVQRVDVNSIGKDDQQKITELIKYVERSIKTIENQQMINIPNREGDINYVLQIPILHPDGIKTGELFIETEKQGDGHTGGKKYHVVMFLNMDALGDIMIDASLVGNRFGCLFKFTDSDAQQFFSPFLDDLRQSITTQGYDCGFLNCITSETISESKEDYHRELFSERCGINVLI